MVQEGGMKKALLNDEKNRIYSNIRRNVMVEFPPSKTRYRFHTWYGRLLMPVRNWLERRCVLYLGRHTKRIKVVDGVRIPVLDEPKTWVGEKLFHIAAKTEFKLRKFLDTRIKDATR
jgi:hypothetical protein